MARRRGAHVLKDATAQHVGDWRFARADRPAQLIDDALQAEETRNAARLIFLELDRRDERRGSLIVGKPEAESPLHDGDRARPSTAGAIPGNPLAGGWDALGLRPR